MANTEKRENKGILRGIPHDKVESNLGILATFIAILVAVGGIVEIVPPFYLDDAVPPAEGVRPYTPLELEGYVVYRREGCFYCHSQMIRPFRDEKERYGHFSLAAESKFDHNFVWGSKRTGPDLARVGGKYSDAWHIQHFRAPRSVVPESVMPNFPWLHDTPLDTSKTQARMRILQSMDVPYSDDDINNALNDLVAQAAMDDGRGEAAFRARYERKRWVTSDGEVEQWTDDFVPTPVNVRNFDGNPKQITELDALIAYIQSRGTMVHFEEGIDYYHDKFGRPYRK